MRYLAIGTILGATIMAGQAVAHPMADATASTAAQIEAIIHGKGKAGDSVTSSSDPSITYTVLENGLIKRTNAHFGTTEVRAPVQDWWQDHEGPR